MCRTLQPGPQGCTHCGTPSLPALWCAPIAGDLLQRLPPCSRLCHEALATPASALGLSLAGQHSVLPCQRADARHAAQWAAITVIRVHDFLQGIILSTLFAIPLVLGQEYHGHALWAGVRPTPSA